MSVSPIRIAARLEYATLDELEAGFAERVGEREVFLAHGSYGALPDEPRVGANVVVEITTASGETAVALEGVIAWLYPPALVPPGREPGTGIAIDRLLPGCEGRVARMRKRGGAGVRVRPPGSRIKAPTIERARRDPVVHRPLPASLFEVPASKGASPPQEASWHAPAPRLMGLALDRTVDPAPQAPPLPREEPIGERPATPPPSSAAPAAVALDALPDLPSALPPSAFEQVPTDVDLLRSIEGAPKADDVARSASFERQPLIDVTGPRSPIAAAALASPAVTVVPLGDDGPEQPDEPLLVSDEDVSPVDEDSTGSHEVPASRLPSLDAEEFHTAEHAAVPPPSSTPSAADWEGRTEHGFDVSEPTAEASYPDQTALPVRPLPDPARWPTPEASPHRPIGIAFMVARRTSEPVGLEVLSWPAQGTKRIGALDEARAAGGDALDQALAASSWLARDASAPPPEQRADVAPYFDPGLTDPGHRVVDVVGAAVQAAETEPDEGDVFSDGDAPPLSANPALDERTVAEEVGAPADDGATLASDATGDGMRASAPLFPDDEVETDRALQRPPTEASAATRNRLGVLQRFLGKR